VNTLQKLVAYLGSHSCANWVLANWNSQYQDWKEAEEEAKKNGTINLLSKPKEYELRSYAAI
jgi:hypothetical protein